MSRIKSKSSSSSGSKCETSVSVGTVDASRKRKRRRSHSHDSRSKKVADGVTEQLAATEPEIGKVTITYMKLVRSRLWLLCVSDNIKCAYYSVAMLKCEMKSKRHHIL
jgi:hypothetical protein